MGLYEKSFGPKILVPWDTLGVRGGPISQGPTPKMFPPIFLGILKGPIAPPGGHFYGEFSFYWISLQPPVGTLAH